MSEHQPHRGAPEYLESTGGLPVPQESGGEVAAGRPRRGRRRVWWAAGGFVVLLAAGAGAWAALGFFHQGAQPAEALPASTIAYVSVDLDPSGGQKIDAFRTLNKFPAFKHDLGVNSVGDLRHKLGSELVPTSCHGITFDQDIDPWLGDRAALALVALPGSQPGTVVVVQVKDDAKARDGISALNDCAGSSHPVGFVVQHGWAVLADSQQVANRVVSAAERSSLAGDATYQKWTKAVGDPGVVNAYAAPDAGHYLARSLGGLLGGSALGLGSFVEPQQVPSALPSLSVESGADTTGATKPVAVSDPLTRTLSAFRGGAATFRFTGDGIELAVAADNGTAAAGTGATGGALVQRLPSDTVVAVGGSASKAWVDHQLASLGGLYGGLSTPQAMRQLSRATGLDLPGDLETLVGTGFSFSVGKGFDLEAAENGSTATGLPIAATVKGDPAGIERVLGKLRGRLGDTSLLGSDSAGDLVVIGPTPAYRQQVLHGGSLGDDPTFTGVVPDAGDASALAYLDVDALEPQIAKALAGDQVSLQNLTPLRAIGWSTWKAGGVSRFSFRVTTN